MVCKHGYDLVDDQFADRKQSDWQQSSDDAEDNTEETTAGPACHTIFSTGGS